MYFNVQAFLDRDYRTIFSGTMVYIPRIGEEIAVGRYIYTVMNVRHLIREGNNLTSDIQLYLKQNGERR